MGSTRKQIRSSKADDNVRLRSSCVGDAVAKTTVTVSGSESREDEDDDGYSATMKPTGDCLPPDPRLVEGPREASQLPPLSARPLTAGLLLCPPPCGRRPASLVSIGVVRSCGRLAGTLDR
jgi:hypothetical protein